MAADQQILREYLVALGFKVNERQAKQMTTTMVGLDKRALGLAKGVVGVGTAIVTMTTLFAKGMERLYYSSRYAETTAARMQELEFGAKQIGLEGGKAGQALKNMTQAIRSNPGLIGLLNSLGIKVTGRDKADVMIDLVKALDKMPPYIAERYAALFGIDPETLFNLREGLAEMEKAMEKRKEMAAEMGLDADEAARMGKEYMNMWREVAERAGIFADVLFIAVLPQVREMLSVTNEVLKDWSKIVQEISRAGSQSFWQKIREGMTGVAEGGGVRLTPEAKARIGAPVEDQHPATPGSLGDYWNRFWKRNKKHGSRPWTDDAAVQAVTEPIGPPGSTSAPQAPTTAAEPPPPPIPNGQRTGNVKNPQELFQKLEKQYGLPNGLLDRVWAKESGRGRQMVGPVTKSGERAEGHFQFMPKTQDEYGLTDPYDLEESAKAAAKKWADLMKRYKGDARMAAAAYNWGDGNLARYGLGKAPAETRDYMDSVAGPAEIKQENNIHIYGATDPKATAAAVAQEQRSVNADLVRNMAPKVR